MFEYVHENLEFQSYVFIQYTDGKICLYTLLEAYFPNVFLSESLIFLMEAFNSPKMILWRKLFDNTCKIAQMEISEMKSALCPSLF